MPQKLNEEECKQPNSETLEAIKKLAEGERKIFQSTEAFYQDLGIDKRS